MPLSRKSRKSKKLNRKRNSRKNLRRTRKNRKNLRRSRKNRKNSRKSIKPRNYRKLKKGGTKWDEKIFYNLNETNCSICFESFNNIINQTPVEVNENNRLKKTHCDHIYCENCLNRVFQTLFPKCSYCRQPITREGLSNLVIGESREVTDDEGNKFEEFKLVDTAQEPEKENFIVFYTGKINNNILLESKKPTQINFDILNNKKIQNIIRGFSHTIALCNEGVYAWGANDKGQLGLGDANKEENYSFPQEIKFFQDKEVKKIVCGAVHSVAVCNDSMYTWGDNTFGQLCKGDTSNASSPVRLEYFSGKVVLEISCGYAHTIAVCNDGVYAWGRNNFGQLGLGNTKNVGFPMHLDFFSGKNIRKISCGDHHTMAVCDDGVYAWGLNYNGQLGLGDNDEVHPPTEVVELRGKNVREIACGGSQTMAVCNDGLYAWGNNKYGQLGLGDTISVSTPTKVVKLDRTFIFKISCAYAHTMVICDDGSAYPQVYAWGRNDKGQLGTGDTNDKLLPVRLDTKHMFLNPEKEIEDIVLGYNVSYFLYKLV